MAHKVTAVANIPDFLKQVLPKVLWVEIGKSNLYCKKINLTTVGGNKSKAIAQHNQTLLIQQCAGLYVKVNIPLK